MHSEDGIGAIIPWHELCDPCRIQGVKIAVPVEGRQEYMVANAEDGASASMPVSKICLGNFCS